MTTRRIGNYEVLELLGQGGMGSVFRCRAPDGSEVAVKTLLRDSDRSYERAVRRFTREVDAMARLQHPNLIRVLDTGEFDGSPFFVMPLVRGQTLQQRIDQLGALSELEAAGLFHKLALALAYAHGCGVLHRDIKPDNVILGEDGEPVLVDFGLVKDEQLDRSHLTRTGAQLGTPGYWSIEQMQGRHELVDARSDVYGLGACLYAALTGRAPYPATSWADLVQQVKHPPPPPSRHRSGLDRRLERVCVTCLRHDPADRYPSADAMARELALYLREPQRRPWVLVPGKGLALLLSAVLLALAAVVVVVARGAAPRSGPPPPADVDPQPPESPESLGSLPQLGDMRADRAALLAGLSYLPADSRGSVPGGVVSFNPRSTVLFSARVTNAAHDSQRHEALVVAARHGEGRVVVLGHDTYLKPGVWPRKTPEETSRWIVAQLFLRNCVRWAGGAAGGLKVGLLDVNRTDALVAFLEADGHEVRDLTHTPSLEGLQLVIWRSRIDPGLIDVDAWARFVAEGGGLIGGTCPWGQQQLMRLRGEGDWRDASVENQVLAPVGLALNRHGYLRAPEDGRYPVDDARAREAHTLATLHAVWSGELEDESLRREALIQVTRAVEALPSRGLSLLAWIARAFRDDVVLFDAEEPAVVGTRAALGVAALNRAWSGSAADVPAALPHASLGDVAEDAPRERRSVLVPAEVSGWIPTGLYAPPDARLAVQVQAGSGVAIRIGAHVDALWSSESYARYPEVSRRWPLRGDRAHVASPFGGLVYLERLEPGRPATVVIEGAVAAPSWDLAEGGSWERAREAAGAWGELRGAQAILSLPRASLRELDDPRRVVRVWDQAVALAAGISGESPPGPLRLVADVQGVSQEEAAHRDPLAVVGGADMGRLDRVLAEGSPAFGVIVRRLAHPAWGVKGLRRGQEWLLATYLYSRVGGRKLKYNRYLSVELFVQLYQDFGWEPLIKAFSSYATLPAKDHPKSDAARFSRFYVTLCTTLQADLEQRFRKAKQVPPRDALLEVQGKRYRRR